MPLQYIVASDGDPKARFDTQDEADEYARECYYLAVEQQSEAEDHIPKFTVHTADDLLADVFIQALDRIEELSHMAGLPAKGDTVTRLKATIKFLGK